MVPIDCGPQSRPAINRDWDTTVATAVFLSSYMSTITRMDFPIRVQLSLAESPNYSNSKFLRRRWKLRRQIEIESLMSSLNTMHREGPFRTSALGLVVSLSQNNA